MSRLLLVMMMFACVPAHNASTTPLLDTEWQLLEIGGTTSIKTAGDRQPHVRFLSEGNRVEGFSGCNTFSGTYELSGSRLRITGPLMMTKRACAQSDLNAQESNFISTLTATTTYTLTAQTLTLTTPTTTLKLGSGLEKQLTGSSL